MLKEEFIELTGYNPSDEEYHYIEQSYYDADTVLKSVFCKQWLDRRKRGFWAIELRLRQEADLRIAQLEAEIAEKEETLQFYREYVDRLRNRSV